MSVSDCVMCACVHVFMCSCVCQHVGDTVFLHRLIFHFFVTCMRCGLDVCPLIGARATFTNEAFFFCNGRDCHPTRVVHKKNGRFSITDYVFSCGRD